MADEFEARLQAVERLLKVFRMERITYLAVTGLALALLLTAAVFLLVRNQADPTTLTLLFGSSGLITYSIGRVLRMWDQAIGLIAKNTVPGTDKS